MSPPRDDKVDVTEVLRELGFVWGSSDISVHGQALVFDFGNLQLTAQPVAGRYLNDVVLFTGVLRTRRAIAEVNFEIPQHCDSRATCLAFLTYYLDNAYPGAWFVPELSVDWLTEGRALRELLPWEKEKARRICEAKRYAVRPHCTIERSWLRLTINTIRSHLSKIDNEKAAYFSFDGTTLLCRLPEKSVAVAANGTAWGYDYRIKCRCLAELPKRLYGNLCIVGIWNGKLEVGPARLPGVAEVPRHAT